MNIEGEVESSDSKQQMRVVVTDVDISFGNLVGLLVKLAFAVIPAAIIIALVWVMILSIFRHT